MYAVSDTWAVAQERFLAPEGLIELSCYIPDLKDTLVYTKKDLLSFTHHQTGSLVSGELPKNSIEFSLDNSDGKWNTNNPIGMERYLSDRLRITLRYGYIIDGDEQWIPGGVFYLSEWNTSPNGVEATFTARDILEYMIDKPYTGSVSGTLYEIAQRAIEEAGIPPEITPEAIVLGSTRLGDSMLGGVESIISLSDELKNYTVGEIDYKGTDSVAVILQKCANAAGCVMYQDRNGVLRIEKLTGNDAVYTIPKRMSYAYPEVKFSRPLKSVSVTYYNNAVVAYPFNSYGETQTLNNDFITTEEQAKAISRWVCDCIRSRQQITGDFRGDPRFDIYDIVDVENKYGTVASVVLTDIKFSFTGAFRVSYSGYVFGSGVAVMIYCGEMFTGEVV